METKWSKNFYWWIVAVISITATVFNTINELYFIAGITAMCFLVAGSNYLKYRRRGE